MVIGFAAVPPVSSPTRVVQDNDKVFLVEETNVISPGLVGSIPAYVSI
jgi:hypothetical protein